MIAKLTKINIDELIDVLMEARKKAEYIDIEAQTSDNTLKIKLHVSETLPPKQDTDFNDEDFSNLIG